MRKRILIIAAWWPSESYPITGIFVKEQVVVLSKEYDLAVVVPEFVSWRDMLKIRRLPKTQIQHVGEIVVYRQYAVPLLPHSPEAMIYGTYARAVKQAFQSLLSNWGKPDLIHAHVVLPAGWAALGVGKYYSLP